LGLQDELDYKQQQLDSAAATGEALKTELAARKAELEKIDTLGSKIDSELEALRGRLTAMQQELATYGAVDAAKAAKEATRAQLEAEMAQLSAKQDAIKVGLGFMPALQLKRMRCSTLERWQPPGIHGLGRNMLLRASRKQACTS
jgi:chromosome segregation ATPase